MDGVQSGEGFLDQDALRLKREELNNCIGSFRPAEYLPLKQAICNIFKDPPDKEEAQGKGGTFHQDPKEEAKTEKAYKFDEIGEQIFKIGEYNGEFSKI